MKQALALVLALTACPPPPLNTRDIPCVVVEGETAATIICDNGTRAIVFKRPDGEWTAGGCYWNPSVLMR